MKIKYKVAAALIAGVAIGGAAIQGLHAQTRRLWPATDMLSRFCVRSRRRTCGSVTARSDGLIEKVAASDFYKRKERTFHEPTIFLIYPRLISC